MRLAAAMMLWATAAQAGDLPLPGQAELTADSAEPALRVATGPWAPEGVPGLMAEGASRHRAWRITGDGGLRPVDLMALPRQALIEQGFDILYECADHDCGGFDFRFALPVVAEPGMHVDLGRYRYLAARQGDRLVAVWASRAPAAGFVQLSEAEGPVGPAMVLRGGVPLAPVAIAPEAVKPAATVAADPAPADPPTQGEAPLFAQGAEVLTGVDFAPGARDLTDPAAPILARLAAWLAEDPARGLVLVGHTDAEGGLVGNIAVSRARAETVRRHLIKDHGADPARITAEGAGWLAPRASNATEAGRAANRRVEALPR